MALKLFVGLAIGILIGTERGWSDREASEGSRIAGIRTFSLIGLLGSVLALLSQATSAWLFVAGFAAVSALIVAAHIVDVHESKDVGTTTAFAMMLTFALAAWATYGSPIPAVAVTVIAMSLLGYKPVLHKWLTKIQPRDFYSGVQLLVISLVLLPLLPNRGYGPWDALNPYWIWWMVVLISGLSFLGYVAIQLTGQRTGTLLTAVSGGLVSSTAVTFSLARLAKKQTSRAIFSQAVLLASSIMFIRVLIEVFVVNPNLLSRVWIPLTVMFAGLVCLFFWLWYRQDSRENHDSSRQIEVKNPLQLGMALQFSALLAVILLLSEAMKEWFGNQGVYVLSVISGLMDVDAITLSLSRSADKDLAAEVATVGIVLASATNTIVKGVIFAGIVGIKNNIRLPLYMLVAMLPGLFIAIFTG
ncbi:MAG: MgtC/SapB family protein [Desulfovibrionales bacterium]